MLVETRSPTSDGSRRFQPQDFAWLLFVAVLIAASPEINYQAFILLPLIGAFQIAEPRIKAFASRSGQLCSIALKLVLCYLLVGWTHTINSFYFPVFFIPIVSAATTFDALGVSLVTAIACAGSFSFLLFLPRFLPYNEIEFADYVRVMSLRVMFFAIVAFVVYQEAKAKRDQIKRTEEAAARLAQANRELKEAQASLRRSERLAALGQLTAGLAHELRNPLGTIKASAEMLMKPMAKSRPEVRDEMADYILSEVERINGLIGSFLDFARPLQIHPADGDLENLLREVEREQAELARGRGVKLAIANEANRIVFPFDRDLLRVALSNLVQNAIQASGLGQEVDVEAQADLNHVTIRISDRGEGIAPQNLESIFNPFFTTKPKGVGLGLALVSKIVDEHGGRITVESELGKGSHFEIVLPRNQR
jgi:two-component system, NtrC family, sensor histidine kinase HydH